VRSECEALDLEVDADQVGSVQEFVDDAGKKVDRAVLNEIRLELLDVHPHIHQMADRYSLKSPNAAVSLLNFHKE
jgi:hypothetical protein